MSHGLRTLMGVLLVAAMGGGVVLPAAAGAQAAAHRSMEDATDLRYAARGILWAEDEEVDISSGQVGLMLSTGPRPARAEDPADQILVRLINATREEMRDKQAACNSATRTLQSEGKDCELKLLVTACEGDKARLNARLALLHKLRGDHRRPLTKLWASVKRSARSVWHRLGPKGRSFFRAFGNDVVQTAVTGGVVNGGVFRTIFLKRVRSTFRQEMRATGERLFQRVTVGYVRASVVPGVPCDEQVAAATSKGEQPNGEQTNGGQTNGPYVIPEDQFGGDDEACQEGWLEDEWPEIEAQFLAEKKACQAGPIQEYRSCLERQQKDGACASDAAAACADLYSAIPTDTLSASGVKGDTGYVWDMDYITFSYGGGSASGRAHIERKDSLDECVYSIDASLTGSFDYPSCSFKGTGTYSWTARKTIDFECLLLGEKGELIEVPIVWEATLKDGNIHGLAHQIGGNGFDFDVPVGEGGQ